MTVKFVKTLRDCPYNKRKGVKDFIYDYDVVDAFGQTLAVWRKISGSKGYFLCDAKMEKVAVETVKNITQPILAKKQAEFALLYEQWQST